MGYLDFSGLSVYDTMIKEYIRNPSSISEMIGATDNKNGNSGAVPVPLIADKDKFLRGDGTWSEIDVESDKEDCNAVKWMMSLLAAPTGNPLFLYSHTQGDTVTSSGRSAINNTGTPSLIFRGHSKQLNITESVYAGHMIIEKELHGWIDNDTNDDYGLSDNYETYTTPNGNTVYLRYMGGTWITSTHTTSSAIINGTNYTLDKLVWAGTSYTKQFMLEMADLYLFDTGKLDNIAPHNRDININNMINNLSVATSKPSDDDYYVSQYAGGGTTNTTYHRRPVSALYDYLKDKTDELYAAKSHTHSYLPLSGGTLTGRLEIPANWTGGGLHINALSGNGINIWGDNEGGNIRIYSPASLETPRYYEIDAQSGGLRVYTTPVDTWSMTVPLQIKPDGIQVSTINGKKINTADTTVFNGIPVIMGDGTMEIGRYLDFHYNNDIPTSTDLSARISVNSTGTLVTSGAIQSGGSILLANGKLLYTNEGNSDYSLKFTYFTNPIFQIIPNIDNKVYLGHTSYRFAEMHAVNMYIASGTAVTSDRRKKNTINDIDDSFAESLIMGFKPVSFKYNDGESDRLHYGFVAQDVEKLLKVLGISSKDFAPLIINKLKQEVIDKSVDGTERHKLVETGEVEYSLRYEEFIAPIVTVIQKQQEKISNLESRLEAIED